MNKREILAVVVTILATTLTLRFYSAGMKYLGQEKTISTALPHSAEELARDELARRIYTEFRWVGHSNGETLFSFNANDNAAEYATQYLWPIPDGAKHRAPCGGDARCPSPEQEEADCIVTVTDCKMDDGHGNYVEPTVLETKKLRCSGLNNCWHDRGDAKRCCREVP